LARSFRLESDGIAFARERIAEGSVIAADDVRHWDVLASSFTMDRIDHSEAYSLDGIHTNLAESFRIAFAGALPFETSAFSRSRFSASSSTMYFFADMIDLPCRLNPTRQESLFAAPAHESN
jgi:hypothetical protein